MHPEVKSQEKFTDAVIACLEKPSASNKLHVIKEAARLGISKNKHQGGIFGLFADAEEMLDNLISGDLMAWAKLIFQTVRDDYFNLFKNLSPFAGCPIIVVECRGNGQMCFSRDIASIPDISLIAIGAKIILASKGLMAKGWYVIIFSPLNFQATNAFRVDSDEPEAPELYRLQCCTLAATKI